MKHLIVFTTRHGTTSKIAHSIAEKIGNTDTFGLKGMKNAPNPENYDMVVLGGPIYLGKLARPLVSYAQRYRDILVNRILGLFILCLSEGPVSEGYINSSFSESLRARAAVVSAFGGRVKIKEINLFERFAVKRVKKIYSDFSSLDEKKIDVFIHSLRNQKRKDNQ